MYFCTEEVQLKIKSFLKWLIKAAAACIIAFAVVSCGCALYYNIPVHYSNETGATDYKWEKSKFYSRGTEGFALGRTNDDGFNNQENPDGKSIDILFTGSSHGEGFNVAQDKNCVSVLNSLFDGEMFAYNIATSSHNLPYLCKDLDAALSEYRPSKYVVIECQSVELKTDAARQAVDGTLPQLESDSEGILGVLQKVPYFRLMYLQLSNIGAEKEKEKSEPLPDTPDGEYKDALEKMIEKISADSLSHNVKPIIIYHPHFSVDENLRITMQHNEKYVELFRAVCEKNGVTFISMEDDFVSAFKNEHKIPYGFSNTEIGSGHLNEYGHSLLAQKLYKTIEDMEAEK